MDLLQIDIASKNPPTPASPLKSQDGGHSGPFVALDRPLPRALPRKEDLGPSCTGVLRLRPQRCDCGGLGVGGEELGGGPCTPRRPWGADSPCPH